MAQPQANNAPPASASRPVATGTATVVVACKMPQGHRARLHTPREVTGVIGGVAHTYTQFFASGEEILFKGPAHGQNEGPRVVTIGGFALTFGVPKDFWDRWIEQHKELDAVKAGLIFAYDRKADAVDAAKERRGLKTGLERLDPKTPVKRDGMTISLAPESPVKIGRLDSEVEDTQV